MRTGREQSRGFERCIIANMQQPLSLMRALRVNSSPSIAFIGAGGKTTAMFQLARELAQPVIVTATSHLGLWQTTFADKHIMAETPAPLEELEQGMKGVILVTGAIDGERTKPIPNELLNWIQQFCGYHSIPLLIEADGSRQKPLKAWAEHEPPVPQFVELVVQVVGLSGLGKPLTEEYVHRPEIFSERSGLKIGETITAEVLTRMLIDSQAELKNIPEGVQRTIILNQADTPALQAIANGMVQPLLFSFDSTVITSLKQERIHAVHERIAGIILAAGE